MYGPLEHVFLQVTDRVKIAFETKGSHRDVYTMPWRMHDRGVELSPMCKYCRRDEKWCLNGNECFKLEDNNIFYGFFCVPFCPVNFR